MRIIREINWKLNKSKLSKIKLLIMDVDGVLTNSQLIYDYEGKIQKVFNVKDGLGLKLLQRNGIKLAFLSGGSSGATNARANDLGIDSCLTDIKDKSKAILDLQKKFKINKSETAYIGDDLNDVVVFPHVSLLIAPRDAEKTLINKSQLILNNKGGNGAIREFAERFLKLNSKWREYCEFGWKDNN